MRWELLVGILVGAGSLSYLTLWVLRHFDTKPRHYPAMADGHVRVCNCGYHSAWDPQLRQHFASVGEVS